MFGFVDGRIDYARTVFAVVCPCAPALVPELATGAEAELGPVRAAVGEAVGRLVAAEPDGIVIVGSDAAAGGSWDESAGGTLGGFGVDVRAGGDSLVLPSSLTLGAWLLDRAGWAGPRTYLTPATRFAHFVQSLGQETSIKCANLGAVVLADGAASRDEQAPGFFDPRAKTFDKRVAEALAAGDPDALAELDTDLAGDLWCRGADALKALGEATQGTAIDGELLYEGAPLGVGYWVATWALAA